MIVCCTHTGAKTTADVMAMATKPVIFSHSNARAVHDHERTDEMIKACAATGGVICTNGIGLFLGDGGNLTESFVQHIDHVLQLVGHGYAGIGLDYVFDQQELNDYLATNKHSFPEGMGYEAGVRMVSPEAVPHIVGAMIARGYTDIDIAAILGGNMLRVASACWAK